MTDLNLLYWLIEQDIPAMGGQPDQFAGGPPAGIPGTPQDPMGGGMAPMGGIATDQPPPEEDVTQDPQTPEMPEEPEHDNFETWQEQYIKESIKGDPNVLIDLINQVRDWELEAYQDKFVYDNLQINLLRQNSNIFQASQEVRKNIKKELDRTHWAVSVVNYITAELEKAMMLNEIFIKLNGTGAAKGDYHRKYIGSLLGAIQVGAGASSEDLVFEETDYSLRISTRCSSEFGEVKLGKWALREDDPERYLKPPELARLDGGSPEEKDVLRRRIVMESIAELFKSRGFIINVTAADGTIYWLGWDMGESLKVAYTEGKLVVRTKESENSEAIIDDDGAIIPSLDWYIYYVRETGQVDEEGRPDTEEVEFMERRDGMLFLTAQLDILKEASTTLNGMVLKEVPWRGNPTDITRITRCVPSLPEILLRQC